MNPVALTPVESARQIVATNLLGTFLFTQAGIRLLRRSVAGRIVNLTTVAVPLRLEGEAMYAASKSAVETFTRIVAREVAAFGITCNAVGPEPDQDAPDRRRAGREDGAAHRAAGDSAMGDDRRRDQRHRFLPAARKRDGDRAGRLPRRRGLMDRLSVRAHGSAAATRLAVATPDGVLHVPRAGRPRARVAARRQGAAGRAASSASKATTDRELIAAFLALAVEQPHRRAAVAGFAARSTRRSSRSPRSSIASGWTAARTLRRPHRADRPRRRSSVLRGIAAAAAPRTDPVFVRLDRDGPRRPCTISRACWRSTRSRASATARSCSCCSITSAASTRCSTRCRTAARSWSRRTGRRPPSATRSNGTPSSCCRPRRRS